MTAICANWLTDGNNDNSNSNKNAFEEKTNTRHTRRQRPSRATAGPGRTFSRAPLGRKFRNFPFQNGAFWCTLYFRATAGLPNVARPGVTYPRPHPLDGPARRQSPGVSRDILDIHRQCTKHCNNVSEFNFKYKNNILSVTKRGDPCEVVNSTGIRNSYHEATNYYQQTGKLRGGGRAPPHPPTGGPHVCSGASC